MLETERLILRQWHETDAYDLYKYACDPDVGLIAGWLPHKSLEESRQVIKNILCTKESYAMCLKSDNKAIGSISLKLKGQTDITDKEDECELGYWLGKPFWGQGLTPEAVREILKHAFEDIGMNKVFCAYYDGNIRSKRVQEKCGFIYQWTTHNLYVSAVDEKRTGHVNCISKSDWETKKINKQ